MSAADLLNGTFELLAAFVVWQNVRALRRDRMVRGVNWRVTMFFAAWGVWNLYYYPSLDQWASFAGGVALVAVNVVWLVLAFRYRNA